MPLHELQLLLGHESLETTSIYTTPRSEDVVVHHRAVFSGPPAAGRPAAPSALRR